MPNINCGFLRYPSCDWHIMKFNALGSEDTTWAISAEGNAAADKTMACALDVHGNLFVGGYGTNLVNGSSNFDLWLKKYINDLY